MFFNKSQPLLLTAQVRFRKPRQRDSGLDLRFALPTVAPGQNSGGTPFRQPCPAYPSAKGRKAPQERFSEESLRTCFIRKRISLSLSLHCKPAVHTTAHLDRQHTTSLDVLAEPNYYSKSLQTSSTRVFASHRHGDWNASRTRKPNHICVSRAGAFPREILRKERSGSRQEAPARLGRALTPPNRLDLLIPSPASTLQVFQFIR
jgi:hypothetical protein